MYDIYLIYIKVKYLQTWDFPPTPVEAEMGLKVCFFMKTSIPEGRDFSPLHSFVVEESRSDLCRGLAERDSP